MTKKEAVSLLFSSYQLHKGQLFAQRRIFFNTE